jgi:hypothetical protein
MPFIEMKTRIDDGEWRMAGAGVRPSSILHPPSSP